MDQMFLLQVGFLVMVLAVLMIDLGVFHRNAHEVTFKEAVGWSILWVTLALLFNAALYFFFWPIIRPIPPDILGTAAEAAWAAKARSDVALEFLTGYLIEQALSVDNIFVFILIFSYFAVPASLQHRVLFWGILGALVMRGIMIFAGAALIERFEWILLFFGVFLIFTGYKMATSGDEKLEPEKNPVIQLVRRFLPISPAYDGQRFFTVRNGVRMATPLFLVLVMVETTDLIFAVDSIPAIFAVTKDPFIVYTSNVMAILGLRSLYFVLGGVMDKFHYLKFGLAFVLAFVGVKMLIPDVTGFLLGHSWHIPTAVSLGVVAGIIAVAIIASLAFPKHEEPGPVTEEHGTPHA